MNAICFILWQNLYPFSHSFRPSITCHQCESSKIQMIVIKSVFCSGPTTCWCVAIETQHDSDYEPNVQVVPIEPVQNETVQDEAATSDNLSTSWYQKGEWIDDHLIHLLYGKFRCGVYFIKSNCQHHRPAKIYSDKYEKSQSPCPTHQKLDTYNVAILRCDLNCLGVMIFVLSTLNKSSAIPKKSCTSRVTYHKLW